MQTLTVEQVKQIKISELTKLLFRHFKRLGPGDNVDSLNDILNELEKDLTISKELRAEFKGKFQEAIHTLQRRGLIMPTLIGKQSGHYFTLTSVGERSDLHDGILILIDNPQEIINSVKEKVPNLDSVVEQYYLESLRACQEGLCISSVICLGAASERAINCLAEAVANYNAKYKADIESQRYISSLTRYLSKNINEIFGAITDGAFRSELRDKLEGIARIYRLNRNEAGHPDNIPQDWQRDEQENYLNRFCRYVMTIFQAIDILNLAS